MYAAVKIDSFAYMPVQDFGNAFSTFIAQNFGAGKKARIQKGILLTSVSDILGLKEVFILALEFFSCFMDFTEQ